MLALDVAQVVGQLGVDEQRLGATVFDDVLDLGLGQAEVDRDEDPPVTGDT